MSEVLIRPAEKKDSADWQRMRNELWPSEEDEHPDEITKFFSGSRINLAEVLLACLENGNIIGFIELSIRPYSEGCYSGRVAFVEGWFVDEQHRRKGVGAALVKAGEDWGRARGCTEIGSDTEIENELSIAAHKSLGFTEETRLVCFRKDL